jgi:hypothetical protein
VIRTSKKSVDDIVLPDADGANIDAELPPP